MVHENALGLWHRFKVERRRRAHIRSPDGDAAGAWCAVVEENQVDFVRRLNSSASAVAMP
jgi:hypothetical protein